MKSDSDIKRDVEEELRFDPDIDATDIGVAVKNGVVTLSGKVHTERGKEKAEKIAKKIKGVTSVQNSLTVMETEK